MCSLKSKIKAAELASEGSNLYLIPFAGASVCNLRAVSIDHLFKVHTECRCQMDISFCVDGTIFKRAIYMKEAAALCTLTWELVTLNSWHGHDSRSLFACAGYACWIGMNMRETRQQEQNAGGASLFFS